MSCQENLNCVLCEEIFEDKESLQTHFRKHADPTFVGKNKKNADAQYEKCENEVVSCDVCTAVFPTISKAITHKHKVHPDHDAKYFCPWCGKLFTMKHLFNKHQVNHETDGIMENAGEVFHCDFCDVDFSTPQAMIYHNKFFHRQDTELSAIGHSTKQKFVNKELLTLYYCAFCGEEYINKVNLHKHMRDDHGDENQSPGEILRCPLCEAIFYHLDAYEVHLTFHSIEDIYNGKESDKEKLSDCTIETVPPLLEKVEDFEETQQEGTAGIDQFLELLVKNDNNESPETGEKQKRKKHKKHKRSKKEAITLDEFLTMNSDVFGEGIDFQGIEEVPTQVVAKHLKVKKKPQAAATTKVSAADLAKLRQQGIVVKKNNQQKAISIMKGVKIASDVKVPVSKSVNVANVATKSTDSVTNQQENSNNLLSRLMNSQTLKIVKKPSIGKTQIDDLQSNKSNTVIPLPYREETQVSAQSTATIEEKTISDTNGKESKSSKELNSYDNLETKDKKEIGNEFSCKANVLKHNEISKESEIIDSRLESQNNSAKHLNVLRNLGQHITIKSSRQSPSLISETTDHDFMNELDTSDNQQIVQDIKKDDVHMNAIKKLGKFSIKTSEQVVKNVEPKRNSDEESTSEHSQDMDSELGDHDVDGSDNDTDKKNDEKDDENSDTSLKAADKKTSLNVLKKIAHQLTIKPCGITVPSNNNIGKKYSDVSDKINTSNKIGGVEMPQPTGPCKPNVISKSTILNTGVQQISVNPIKLSIEPHADSNEDSFSDNDCDLRDIQNRKISENRIDNPTIQKLKIMNKQISIKPLNQIKTVDDAKTSLNDTNMATQDPVKQLKNDCPGKDSMLQALKKINNQLTVKSSKQAVIARKEIEENACDGSDGEHEEEGESSSTNNGKKAELPLLVQNIPCRVSKNENKNGAMQALQSINQGLTNKPSNNSYNLPRDEDNYENEYDNEDFDDQIPSDSDEININSLKKIGSGITLKSANSSKVSTRSNNDYDSEDFDDQIPSDSDAINLNAFKKIGSGITIKPANSSNISNQSMPAHSTIQNKTMNKVVQSKTSVTNSQQSAILGAKMSQFSSSSKVSQEMTIKSLSRPTDIIHNQKFSNTNETKKIDENVIYSIDDSDTDEMDGEESHKNVVSKALVPFNQKNRLQNALLNTGSNTTVKEKLQNLQDFDRNIKKEPDENDSEHGGSMNDDSEHEIDSSEILNRVNSDLAQKLQNFKSMSIKKMQNTNQQQNSVKTSYQTPRNVTSNFNFPVTKQTQSQEESEKLIEKADNDDDISLKPQRAIMPAKCASNIKQFGSELTIKSLSEQSNQVDENHDFESSEENEEHIPTTGGNNDILNKLKSYGHSFTIKSNRTSEPNSNNNLKIVHRNVESKIPSQMLKRDVSQTFDSDAEGDDEANFDEDSSLKPCKIMKTNPANAAEGSNSKGKDIRQTVDRLNAQSKVINQQQLQTKNSVNQEITRSVKTIQTKTVIQEITTTVTKTIKTVNQTVSQQVNVASSSQVVNNAVRNVIPAFVRPQRVIGMRPSNPNLNNYQGITVRNTSPINRPQIRQMRPTRPGTNTAIRSQGVPVRQSGAPIRPVLPRMPNSPKLVSPRASQAVNKPLRIAPSVIRDQGPKPPSEGHFSCFKKPKESLIPETVFGNEATTQFASSSHSSQSNYSATKTVKSNSGVLTATHTKSEVTSSSHQQQLSKLCGVSGLRIVKSSSQSSKQTVNEVQQCEVSPARRDALSAIEKLQRQGLLVKKPRLDESYADEDYEHSDSNSDNDNEGNSSPLAIESGR